VPNISFPFSAALAVLASCVVLKLTNAYCLSGLLEMLSIPVAPSSIQITEYCTLTYNHSVQPTCNRATYAARAQCSASGALSRDHTLRLHRSAPSQPQCHTASHTMYTPHHIPCTHRITYHSHTASHRVTQRAIQCAKQTVRRHAACHSATTQADSKVMDTTIFFKAIRKLFLSDSCR
jgi:hypothetical protein